MKKATVLKKRPCPICRRWFPPNARLKERQKTCGATACKREWHRRKCADWNKKNSEYFKANSLQRKLESVGCQDERSGICGGNSEAVSRASGGPRRELPVEIIQEVMGAQAAVIIEYLAQHLLRRVQEVIRRQVRANTS